MRSPADSAAIWPAARTTPAAQRARASACSTTWRWPSSRSAPAAEAAEDALAGGFGRNLAGGTHRAGRSAGSGFCVFNDLAVAILALRARGRIRRAAIIDLDVHQGDGTAEIFARDPAVLTLSVHGRNNFPFRKRQSRIDLDLPDGAGDGEFLRAVEAVLPRVFASRPEIVF